MQQTEIIQGGSGAGTINATFTVTGSAYALDYVDTLVGAVQAILATRHGNTETVAPQGGFEAQDHPAHKYPIYQLVPPTVQSASATYDITTSGYVIDSIGGAVAINGDSAGGDSIIAFADGQAATVNTEGSNNLVIFTTGNNYFNGSTSGGNETVVGGTGNDVINTGTGSTVINAGTGSDLITLNDTVSGAYNDSAYLDTGLDTVIANGAGDYVLASVGDERIVGGVGESAASNLTVVLIAGSTGDTVTGGAGYLSVTDAVGGNKITGGAGGLTFIAGANIVDTIVTGASTALIFGNAGDSIALATGFDGAGAAFTAGAGNETLDGSAATAALTLFGAASSDGTAVSDVLRGGSGNDTLIAGTGTETLIGEAGANIFLVDSVGAANSTITVADFAGADSLAFSGYTAGEVASVLANSSIVNGTFVAVFTDSNTTLTVPGITSLSQISGHVITF
jgi:Ca2+-binding RTX toxin-like protein